MITSRLHGLWLGILNWKIIARRLSGSVHKNKVREIFYYSGSLPSLLSYQDQGVVLPEHPKGLIYRNMGTMENHIWSVIAKRMKPGERAPEEIRKFNRDNTSDNACNCRML